MSISIADPRVNAPCEFLQGGECAWRIEKDILGWSWWIQHGVNPEHCLQVTWKMVAEHGPNSLRTMILEWVAECHKRTIPEEADRRRDGS